MAISTVQRKRLIAFIKAKYPIGSFVYDSTRSKPYKVKKTSVFEVQEWDYNEEFMPENDEDIFVDFLVRDAGKYSESYMIKAYPKKWCKL
jgi:hypothetical protein